MNNSQNWYIIPNQKGECEIIQVENEEKQSMGGQYWGPFASQQEAIARRVGLIRAGKCKPVV